jgi:hypothetical protein
MSLTLKQFAALGGKASWKGTTKEQRVKHMRKLANKRWKGHKKVINSAGLRVS